MKTRKILERVFSCVFFAGLCFAVWLFANQALILKREDGITSMEDFYAQKDRTVDVLILGSSHAGTNIDLEVLWDQFGYSAYALWGSKQPMWNSYYFLKEALKTQSPSVVILDMYGAVSDDEYMDEARQLTNIGGMKYSLTRLEAVMASAPRSRWSDLFLGLPIYHTRYGELDTEDFQHYPWTSGLCNEKGYSTRFGSDWTVDTEAVLGSDVHPLSAKQEKYLRMIMELCREKGIHLYLVTTPTAQRSEEQPYYNAIREIADANGIDFRNMNELDAETGIGTDDYSFDDSHLNTQGARKVATYLGKMLSETGLVEDHRGEAGYESWDTASKAWREGYMKQILYLREYIEEVRRDGYVLSVSIGRDASISEEAAGILAEYDIQTDASGIYDFGACPDQLSGMEIPVAESGKIILRVMDPEDGHEVDSSELTGRFDLEREADG